MLAVVRFNLQGLISIIVKMGIIINAGSENKGGTYEQAKINAEEWKLISEEHPPINKVIKTKIDDKDGVRNEQELKYDGRLWWFPDGSMYVYYQPTHWWCWL